MSSLPYNIHFGEVQSALKKFFNLNSYSKVAILVDENTKTHCYPLVKNAFPKHVIIELVSGEHNKNIHSCERVWSQLTKENFDRHGLLVNLGGGVIGDLGGFCASSFKRGINFINIPTSLLAMVDASVGGKTGIDFKGFKNQIGLFSNPQAVFVDDTFLQTLDIRQVRSGFAEMIKHALISGESIWERVRQIDINKEKWLPVIESSVLIKSNIVVKDFKESGLRKILNFGHTIGHAIESYFMNMNNTILHGEAIAAGMICELQLSKEISDFDTSIMEDVITFLLNTYGKLDIDDAIQKIALLTMQDKKNASDQAMCVLLKEIGDPKIDIAISTDQIKGALSYYNQLNVQT